MNARIAILILSGLPGAGVAAAAQTADAIDERVETLRDQRRMADATIWRQEQEAQRFEQSFVALWDGLRATREWWAPIKAFTVGAVTVGSPGAATTSGDGDRLVPLDAEPRTLDRSGWHTLLDRIHAEGYEIVQTEWHQVRFESGVDGPARSRINVVLHVAHPATQRWIDVSGPIEVTWSDRLDHAGHPVADSIDATALTARWRSGPVLFKAERIAQCSFTANYSNLIARDLDGDGDNEVIVPGDNLLLRNDGEGNYTREKLFENPLRFVLEGLLADLNGDGRLDYLVTGTNPRRNEKPEHVMLLLYEGTPSGFTDVPRSAVAGSSPLRLKYPLGMTAGDIDGDGDLDLFVPQYLQPYVGGQFPTPYYDANDGHPSYLLVNDGHGFFVDGTEAAGLTAKRNRRTFRSSLLDLDDDGDLDLLVISDFAGIDVWANDGDGNFTDVTATAVDESTNFGMAHTFGDFNADGHLDFYVTGMASTTARRLHAMGAGRQELPEHQTQRLVTGYGNRLYLRVAPGRYEQPQFKDTVARSGWSWGTITLDYNLDGWPDLYVVNGNKSGKSAKDYCTTFWCHDIYSGSSQTDRAQFKLYLLEAEPYVQGNMSWNGFEHNHLFRNEGDRFSNVGFLANVALEADCRALLVDDVDLDGRPDLIVDAKSGAGDVDRDLWLFRNVLETDRHWIGVRVGESKGRSSLGARILLTTATRRQASVIVSGESYGAQLAPMRHFGLGDETRVTSIEVTWPDGTTRRLSDPAIDRYHTIDPS